jgi:hypothetical protein
MTTPPDLSSVNIAVAKALLLDPDTHALAATLAANRILGGELIDDDEEIPDESELTLLLDSEGVEADKLNVTRIVGYLNALASEEFIERPVDLMRISSAIIEGDPFFYENEGEDVPLWCVLWAIYQVDLMLEDNIIDEMSERVKKHLQRMGREEAVDVNSMLAGEGGGGEVTEELIELRGTLANQLRELGVAPDWVDHDAALSAALIRNPD